jgi:hypothetical protein
MAAEHRVILLRGVKPKTPAGWLSGGKRVGAATAANASTFTSIAGLAQRLASDTAALDEAEAVAKNKVWEWQMSTDGGTTWTTIAGTNAANFLVENLTPCTLPSFRCRSTAKNTTSAWSQTIVLMVL